MSTKEVFVQQFAKLFAHYNDSLVGDKDTAVEHQSLGWRELPCKDRDRMVAAARLALLEIETTSKLEDNSRRYYARPGEAEWGC